MSDLPLYVYPLLFAGALILSAVLTPVALGFATRHHILDHPGPAKSHTEAVPYLGGAAIVVAFSVAVGIGALVDPPSAGLSQLGALLGMAVALALVGLVDDVAGLAVWLRLAVEVAAGIGVVASGVVLHVAGFPSSADDVASVVWVVVVTNAFNLLDNMDGLSAGVAAIASLGLFGIAVMDGEFLVAALAVALAGCAAGFLRQNFHPARIYMGDAGSLFLGFVLSVLALKLRDNPATRVDVAALIAVLGVALFDTALVVLARIAHRRSPFVGGQDHTSHRLLHLGLPVRMAVGMIYLVASTLAGIGVLLARAGAAVHLAGIVVLGVVGLVVLAAFLLVPVYGDALDERLRTGPLGREVVVGRPGCMDREVGMPGSTPLADRPLADRPLADCPLAGQPPPGRPRRRETRDARS